MGKRIAALLTIFVLSVFNVFAEVIDEYEEDVISEDDEATINWIYSENRQYTAEARELIRDSIVLYDGSSSAFVNGALVKLDRGNPLAKAVTIDGRLHVPASFLAQHLGVAQNIVSTDGYLPVKGTAESMGYWVFESGGAVLIDREALFQNGDTRSLLINPSVPQTVLDEIVSWLKFEREEIVRVTPEHKNMKFKIGEPSYINSGEDYPAFTVVPFFDGELNVVMHAPDEVKVDVYDGKLLAFEPLWLKLDGTPSKPGVYKVSFTTRVNGEEYYDHIYFNLDSTLSQGVGKSRLAYLGTDGKMVYVPDYKGNRIIDFSTVGYKGGGVELPNVPAVIELLPNDNGEDDTQRIQAAVDAVAALPLRENGFRGAILMKKGVYRIAGSVQITDSGIVIRGEGWDEISGTTIIATGTLVRNIFEVTGSGAAIELPNSSTKIKDYYAPVGETRFRVKEPDLFAVGDKVIVRRMGNEKFINYIKMDSIKLRDPRDPNSVSQWPPFNLNFERKVVDVSGDTVTVDGPIACAIDEAWGGGYIIKMAEPGRIENIGFENIYTKSEYASPTDEKHAFNFIVFENVANAWARDIKVQYYMHGISTLTGAKYVTIQDSVNIDPVSIITGGRRYPFQTSGQMVLVQRCYCRDDRHGYALGSRVPGPNVFLDSRSENNHAASEPHHRWSVGGLYDNIYALINILNRGNLGTGQGWSGANYVTWNTEGTLSTQQPPTAQNWAIGHVGTREDDTMFEGDPGLWDSHNIHVEPRSLYLQQLEERLGEQAVHNIRNITEANRAYPELVPLEELPQLNSLSINGVPIDGFSPDKYTYTIDIPHDNTALPFPKIEAEVDDGHEYTVIKSSILDKIYVCVRKTDVENSGVMYTLLFKLLPPGETVSNTGKNPLYAVDGNPDTAWSCVGNGFIQHDFQEQRELDSVRIKWVNGQMRKTNFSITTSEDGFVWKKSYEGTSSGKTKLYEVYTFPNVEARYVRIECYGNDFNDQSGISEVSWW